MNLKLRYRIHKKKEKLSRIESIRKTYEEKKSMAGNTLWGPTYAEKQFAKGENYYYQKDYQLALEHFKNSYRRRPHFIPLHFYFLSLYRILSLPEELTDAREELIDRFPELIELPMFKSSHYKP